MVLLRLLLLLLLSACAASPTQMSGPLVSVATTTPDVDMHSVADVASYKLDVTLESDHRTVHATEVITWTNTSQVPVHDLWWHLYMNGYSGEDTLFMRSGAAQGHRGHAANTPGFVRILSAQTHRGEQLEDSALQTNEAPRDRSEWHSVLMRPVMPGETLSITVAFTTVLPGCFARTCAVEDFAFAGQWFPKLAVLERDGTWSHFPFHAFSEFYADFGRYEVTLHVPQGDVVGASGELVEHTGSTWRFVAEHVHDFAWTAWKRFEVNERVVHGTRVRVLSPPWETETAARTFRTLETAIPLFARRFGPYPYPTLTVVAPPRMAEGVEGMEYPTLITTISRWDMLGTEQLYAYVTLHEFGHQYFQGMLASNEHAYPMLDEGLAEYATCVGLDALYPSNASLFAWGPVRVGCWDWQASGAGYVTDHGPLVRGATEFKSFGHYAVTVYRRTAAWLRTMELLYGEATIARALRRYTATRRFSHPRPEDLLAALRTELPSDVVDGWIRSAMLMDSTFDLSARGITQSQSGAEWNADITLHRDGSFVLDTDVLVVREDGSKQVMAWTTRDPQTVLHTSGRARVTSVMIDPDARLMLDQNVLNNGFSLRESSVGAAVGSMVRTASWTAWLLRVVGP